MHGCGVLEWGHCERGEGEYVDGSRHGRWIETRSDGTRWEQHYRNGCAVGAAKQLHIGAAASALNDRGLLALSAKELKAAATSLEVDIVGCFEKKDLIKAFKRANVSSDQVTQAAAAAALKEAEDENDRELSAHSVKDLKTAARSLEVDIAGCFEKDELVKAFKRANASSDQVAQAATAAAMKEAEDEVHTISDGPVTPAQPEKRISRLLPCRLSVGQSVLT